MIKAIFKKLFLAGLRPQLRKIDWLVHFYRKYIIKMPLDYKQGNIYSLQETTLSVDDINNIRGCALSLEEVDLAKASVLMTIALKFSPNGKLIKQKLAVYRKLLMLG